MWTGFWFDMSNLKSEGDMEEYTFCPQALSNYLTVQSIWDYDSDHRFPQGGKLDNSVTLPRDLTSEAQHHG